jgi:hypothetical protein
VTRLPSIETAADDQPNAMGNDQGDVFYPDNEPDALLFFALHQARPLHPDRFPYSVAATTIGYLCPALESLGLETSEATQHQFGWERDGRPLDR